MNVTRCLVRTGLGLFGLALVCVLPACGKEDGEVVPLNVLVVGPDDDRSDSNSNNWIAGFPLDILGDVDEVRVRAFRGNTLLGEQSFSYEGYTGRLPRFPFGPDTWLSIEAFSSDSVPLASGATARFDSTPGAAPADLTLFTSAIERFQTVFRYNDADAVSERSTFELGQGRSGHTLTRLADGRILVIGGADVTINAGSLDFGEFHDTAEIFDPTTGEWFAVTESGCNIEEAGVDACALHLNVGRAFHTATLLDDGSVFIFGGLSSDPDLGERVDPIKKPQILVFEGSLEGRLDDVLVDSTADKARAFHTATNIGDGRVVLIGGITGPYLSPNYIGTVDEFVAAEATVYGTDADLSEARALHTATFIEDGGHGILVVGGRNSSAVIGTSEVVYDDGGTIGVDTFEVGTNAADDLEVARFGHSAVTYGVSGPPYVAIAGGYTTVADSTPLNGGAPTGLVETYDSYVFLDSAEFDWVEDAQVELATPRALASASLLTASQDLVIAGGVDDAGTALASGERVDLSLVDTIDCDEARFQGDDLIGVAGGMGSERIFAQAIELDSLYVLFVGGSDGSASLSTAEYYNPDDYWCIE